MHNVVTTCDPLLWFLAQSHVEPTSLVATAAYGNVSQVSSMWVPVLVPMVVRVEAGVEGQPGLAARPDDRGKRKESERFRDSAHPPASDYLDRVVSLSPPVRLSSTRFPQSPQGGPYQ